MLIAGAIIGVVLAYLVGSIPSAYILLRLVKGIDIRTVGSQNVGTLNAYSQLGPAGGIGVLAADAGKGALGFFLPAWLGAPEWVSGLGAAAALAGHNWPIYLKFRGGKGAATVLGIGLAMSPIYAAIAVGGRRAVAAGDAPLGVLRFRRVHRFRHSRHRDLVKHLGRNNGVGHDGLGDFHLHVALSPTHNRSPEGTALEGRPVPLDSRSRPPRQGVTAPS